MNRDSDAAAAELRELIREANGSIKELARLLRECRSVIASGAEQARTAAGEAGNQELNRYTRHLQAEMNRHTASLAEAVDKARSDVIRSLTLKSIRRGPDGNLQAIWAAGNFDADVPLPAGPEMADSGMEGTRRPDG